MLITLTILYAPTIANQVLIIDSKLRLIRIHEMNKFCLVIDFLVAGFLKSEQTALDECFQYCNTRSDACCILTSDLKILMQTK